MVGVGGADEAVVTYIHLVPYPFDVARHFVDELFGGEVDGGGFFFYLLPVLVGARLEADVIALKALETRQKVGKHYLVNVADMRRSGGIRNCGCQVIFGFFHKPPSFFRHTGVGSVRQNSLNLILTLSPVLKIYHYFI